MGDTTGNGKLGGSVAVLHGGTLGGSGTVGSGAGSSVTVASGGTLAAGNSIGTLTIDGDLAFASGSRFEVEVDPAGSPFANLAYVNLHRDGFSERVAGRRRFPRAARRRT